MVNDPQPMMPALGMACEQFITGLGIGFMVEPNKNPLKPMGDLQDPIHGGT